MTVEGMTINASRTVSAVVVSYFTGPLLARCIASLQEQPEIGQIIIVDNGNPPGEVERAANPAGGAAAVIIKSGHGNIGFAAACNLGAKEATGEYLLFLNPDAQMPQGGVAQLIADGDELETPWLLGAKLVGPDGIEQQGSRRETLTPWRAFVEATKLYAFAPRHPYFRRFNLHREKCPEEVTPVPTISGACMFLPRASFDAIDGMDERYFLHVEDIDFCLRMTNAGGGVYFTPYVSITHYKSSSRANAVRIEARKTASMIRYFRAHFADPYPAPFLWLVYGAVWVPFGLIVVKRAIGRSLGLAQVGVRRGAAARRRAKAIVSRRADR